MTAYFKPNVGLTIAPTIEANYLLPVETPLGFFNIEISQLITFTNQDLVARVEVLEGNQATPGAGEGANVLAWTVVAVDTQLVPGQAYIADARLGPLTMSLPPTVVSGEAFVVRAYGGEVTIIPNGLLIEEAGVGNQLGLLPGETVSLAALDATTVIMVN